MMYFDTNHFFEQQHDFHPSMSCVTLLLQVMEDWTKTLDDGKMLTSFI